MLERHLDVIDELFKYFDLDAYYENHDVPEMVDWGKPQGREIFNENYTLSKLLLYFL